MPTDKQLLDAQRVIDTNIINAQVGGGSAPQPANGAAVVTTRTGNINRTKITLAALALVLADNPGVIAYASKKLMSFPKGQIRILSIVPNLAVTKTSAGVIAAFNGFASIGTVAANNTATLTGTEGDIMASVATPAAVAGATTIKGINSTPAIFDGTVAAKDVYLNELVTDTDHDVTTTPCNLLVTGTVTILWENLGG